LIRRNFISRALLKKLSLL